ncbi:MAG: type II toxin-antitoxin system VapC family toxin [Acidobacteriota bacterium]
MRLLLDTHALLWWLFDDPQLSKTARELIADPEHIIHVSSASAWEISTKYRLGKLPDARPLVRDMTAWIRRAGFEPLAVTVEHAQRAGGWPQDHRDPFDRMLAAQSALDAMPLITRDPALTLFDIAIVW